MRPFLSCLCGLLVAASAAAQTQTRGGTAVPPDRAALDRLNLTSDWSAHIPIDGRQDGIARVQVAEDTQVFVQTKAGLLVAIDAFTGRTLWKFKLPSGYSSHFPVGFNDRYVVVLNVAKLFILDRYKGSLEIEFSLPNAPASGPVVDAENFYLTLTGSSVQGYAMPRELTAGTVALDDKPGNLVGNAGAAAANERTKSPADALAERFASRMNPPRENLPSERIAAPESYTRGGGQLGSNQRTPSLTTLRTVVPPYTLGNLNRTESLIMLPSVHKPYSLHPEHLRYTQQSPSVIMLNSMSQLAESSNLRIVTLKPQSIWTYSTRQKPVGEPVLVRTRDYLGLNLWLLQDGTAFVALGTTGQPQAQGNIETNPVSPLAGPYAYAKDLLLGFVTLADGRLMAIDMLQSKGESPRYEWKAKVGGYLNHKPIGAFDGIYVSGEHSGIARVNVKTGDVDWRTDESVDTLLAVNAEHVYARDRRGMLQVYETGKVYDRATLKARPLSGMSIENFNVAVSNGVTDRLYLAAETGLIVSLRDSAAKYAKPGPVGPASTLPPPPKAPMEPKPGDPAAPPAVVN